MTRTNHTVASLLAQKTNVLITDVANALFYDGSHTVYALEAAVARLDNGGSRPTITAGEPHSLHIQKPSDLRKARRISRRTAQGGGYIPIRDIFVFRPNVVCCGYFDGVLFAEAWRLNPSRMASYIWYVSAANLRLNKKTSAMEGPRDLIAQSASAKGLVAIRARKPLLGSRLTELEVSTGTGLNPWVPLHLTA